MVTHQSVNGAAAPIPQSSGDRPSILIKIGIKNTTAECKQSFGSSGSGAPEHQYTDGGGGKKCSGTFAATGALEIRG